MAKEKSWWDYLEEAEEQRKELKEFLARPTLSAKELDYLTDALKAINETTAIARSQLGLTD